MLLCNTEEKGKVREVGKERRVKGQKIIITCKILTFWKLAAPGYLSIISTKLIHLFYWIVFLLSYC